MQPQQASTTNTLLRVRLWYGLLLAVASVFLVRLFYLQIIKHDYYQKAALSGQLKQYEIPASRGIIEAYNGDTVVPIVLNEKLYTLFADPKFIEDPKQAAEAVQAAIGGDADEYEQAMRQDNRYAILAKKLDKTAKEKLDELELKGIGTREEEYRTYPQGDLAAQVLGFVNDEGKGTYGLEEYADSMLRGTSGQLRAITDAQGVPLVSNEDNVVIEPKAGKRVLLTIDISMQQHLEELLKAGLDKAQSQSGSALIMDPYTGEIKAMANYPSFDPAKFYEVDNPRVFTNAAVSSPLEIGSIMKPLMVAAALDQGAVHEHTSFFDPGFVTVDGKTVTNVEEVSGPATRTVTEVLTRSLNTGAVYLLQRLGGGEINEQARLTWHDYMTNHFQLGKLTGIEQGYESGGNIPDPTEGFGLNIQFANTAFGQGMTATPLQMGAALSSIINGGTYYKPRLIDRVTAADGEVEEKEPEVVRRDVISAQVSAQVKGMMEAVFTRNHAVYGTPQLRPQYSIGAKTGTAQIPNPEGGYFEDKYNGTFMGFVGGDKPQYVVVVRVDEPGIPGYAGSRAAGPIFSSVITMLIDNFKILPRSQ